VITLDFYDWQGGPLTCASPEQLFDLAAPHLARLGIARRNVRLLAKTVADNAYPVFHKGYASLRARSLDAAASIEGLLSTGRAGLFLHVNQHHAVEMGLAAGRAALCSTHTSTRWREAAQRFEAARVVD
jgi:protoporphyrinogen oxidase